MNSFGTIFHDKIFPLTIPWLLTTSLTFPWHVPNSLTFSGFPGFPEKWPLQAHAVVWCIVSEEPAQLSASTKCSQKLNSMLNISTVPLGFYDSFYLLSNGFDDRVIRRSGKLLFSTFSHKNPTNMCTSQKLGSLANISVSDLPSDTRHAQDYDTNHNCKW